jgi:hypothetical protein
MGIPRIRLGPKSATQSASLAGRISELHCQGDQRVRRRELRLDGGVSRTARCLRPQFGIEEPTAGLLQPVEENLLVQKMQEQCGEVGKRFVESRHVDVGRLHEMAGRPARLLLGVREQWLLRGIGIRTTAMGT